MRWLFIAALFAAYAPVKHAASDMESVRYVGRFDWRLDGGSQAIQVAEGIARYELARGLDPNAEHEVSLTRVAEAPVMIHQLLGFEVDGEMKPAPPCDGDRRRFATELAGMHAPS
jgi:hypothetical protein